MATIRSPTEEQIKATWEPYVAALGKVAHAWNYLQEALGHLFTQVTGFGSKIPYAIWYSSNNDRTQRQMLRAAIEALPEDHWGSRLPRARDDIIWLIDEADKVANKRNDAIHAPCSITISARGFEITPEYFFGNPRARSLKKKNILKEFAWYELSAETLTRFARDATTAIASKQGAWPGRPRMPTPGQGQSHREEKKKGVEVATAIPLRK